VKNVAENPIGSSFNSSSFNSTLDKRFGNPVMITLRYFAQLRETLHCSEETLQWQDDINTVAALKKQLSQRTSDKPNHPHNHSYNVQWQKAFNGNILCAVNQEIAQDNHPIQDNDEVAFFPPVTGG
jgi:sulfur-carrier protein